MTTFVFGGCCFLKKKGFLMTDINFQMFCDYLRELEKIAQTPLQSTSDDSKYYQEIILSDDIKWFDIRAYNEQGPVGFLDYRNRNRMSS